MRIRYWWRRLTDSGLREEARWRKTRRELYTLLDKPWRQSKYKGIHEANRGFVASGITSKDDYKLVVHGLKQRHIDFAIDSDDPWLIDQLVARTEVRYSPKGWIRAKVRRFREAIRLRGDL